MLLRLLMADKEELERVNLLTHHADKLTKVCRTVLDYVMYFWGQANFGTSLPMVIINIDY